MIELFEEVRLTSAIVSRWNYGRQVLALQLTIKSYWNGGLYKLVFTKSVITHGKFHESGTVGLAAHYGEINR